MLLPPASQGFILQETREVPEGCAAKPAMVRLDGEPVLEIRSVVGARSLESAAEQGSRTLRDLARDDTVAPEDIVAKTEGGESFILLRREGEPVSRLGVLNERVARCYGMEHPRLAERTRDAIRTAMVRYRQAHSVEAWLRGSALAALVLAFYVLWLRLQFRLNGRIRDRIARRDRFFLQKLSRLGLSGLLDAEQVRRLMQRLRATLHWTVLLLISYLLVPLLLGFFPPTRGIASGLRRQVLDLALGLLRKLVGTIPNLLAIAVILAISALVIRGSNSVFEAIRLGRLRLPGFYREWARPTSRLVALVISVAALVISFPYIPGSGSKVFQGAGLFVGLLAALGSSSVASNVISGLMLIYTRAFREGDLVKLGGEQGVVQERTLLVTRLRTPRNELVSVPNAAVISSSVVNFTFSRREIREPVALATTITIGYDVPWRQVEELMLSAARSVEAITDEVDPFVLQTSLNDFHISYELNAYLRDSSTYRQTLSQLHAALQDVFARAGVEILSPGYHAIRNGNPSTVPPLHDEQPEAAEGLQAPDDPDHG